MNYINTQTNYYPVAEDGIRAAFPNTSFPAALAVVDLHDFGFAPVIPTIAPSYNTLAETIAEGQPAKVGNTYQQTWEVVPLPAATCIANAQNIAQQHLDAKARERNYDGILSACSYATSTSPRFVVEAQACVKWRDDVWAKCYDIMSQVQAGTLPMPTPESLVAELPVLVWPL